MRFQLFLCSLLICILASSLVEAVSKQEVVAAEQFPLTDAAADSAPKEVDTASIQKRGRMVILVNKNSLRDEQQPRNHAEEAKKRSEMDAKQRVQQFTFEQQKQEQAEKKLNEEKTKAEEKEKVAQKEEASNKETRRQKAESEQKEKARIQESDEKKRQQAAEAAEKDRKNKAEQEDKEKRQAAEQQEKKEQQDKKAAEEKQKQDPCFNPSRKFVPSGTDKTYQVSAFSNSIQEAGFPLDTGIFIKKGSAIAITASGMWNAAGNDLGSDANGLQNFPLYNYLGLNARYGSLVGRIGNGPYFVIGTDFFTCRTDQEGRLWLMYWDSDSMNNKNSVTVKVTFTKAQEEGDRCFQKQVPNGFLRNLVVNAKDNSVGEAGIPLNTQAYISRGSSMRITANGEWYASFDNGLYATPNGRVAEWNGLRFFSLVGRIGSGGWFFVGSDFFSCDVNQEGFLQLAYWDVNSGDNRGSIQVALTYERKQSAREDDCNRRQITNARTRSLSVAAKENSVNQGSPLDTGMDVLAGSPLKITAAGKWYAAYNNQLEAGPDGWPNIYGFAGVNLRFFSLVGKIANGNYFFVGADYFTCVAPSNGRLYLAYWDSNNYDNSGAVNAVISVAQ